MSKRQSRIEVRRGIGKINQVDGVDVGTIDVWCFKYFDQLLERGLITRQDRQNYEQLHAALGRILVAVDKNAKLKIAQEEILKIKSCFNELEKFFSEKK